MPDPTTDAPTTDDAASLVAEVKRPAFVSEDVWRVVELAAKLNEVPIHEYVEKALLDEAIILEQVRIGHRWMVENKQGDVGAVVDFQ